MTQQPMTRPTLPPLALGALVLLGLYAVSYVLRWRVPAAADALDVFSLVLEVSLDLVIVCLATGLARPAPRSARREPSGQALRSPYGWVAGSFAASGLSAANLGVLSRGFGVVLSKARGTWLELEINLPYVTFFALGVLALGALALARRGKGALGSCAGVAVLVTGAIAFRLQPALALSGFALQSHLIQLLGFCLSGLIGGTGLFVLCLGARLGDRLLALGYLSIALSGTLFQATVLSRGALVLDTALDLTWTLGQFTVILGLVLLAREAPQRA